jgi:heat shock protein HslJ
MFDKKYQLFGLMAILTVFLLACSPAIAEDPITEISWQWVGLVETQPAAQSVVPNAERFTLYLDSDGSISLQVDCNAAGGSYSLKGDALSISVGASTLAYCGDDSLDQQYLQLLAAVESYALEDGSLFLNLADGAGKMLFE